jgi:creatinine amidohydrolase
MNYKWENLTAYNFKHAVKNSGELCIVPLGVIEKHGPHLPLGTDMFQANKIAELAVQMEPAVIFPPYYLTMIHEAKPQPGTIAIDTGLVRDLLENICDEIYRNGFKKIILLNGHGGNCAFLRSFVSSMMIETKHGYNVYLADLEHFFQPALNDERYLKLQDNPGGHGGEEETSIIMSINEELVKLDELEKHNDCGFDKKRMDNLNGYVAVPGMDWYASFPDHYAGDGKFGTVEKGNLLLKLMSERVAKIIKVVKEDINVDKVKQEFFSHIVH